MTKVYKVLPLPDFALLRPDQMKFNKLDIRPDRGTLLQPALERFGFNRPFHPHHPAMTDEPSLRAQQDLRAELMQTDRAFHLLCRQKAIAEDVLEKVRRWHETEWRLNELHAERWIAGEALRRRIYLEKSAKGRIRQEEIVRQHRSQELTDNEFVRLKSKEHHLEELTRQEKLSNLAGGAGMEGQPVLFSWTSAEWPEDLREKMRELSESERATRQKLGFAAQLAATAAFQQITQMAMQTQHLAQRPEPLTPDVQAKLLGVTKPRK